MKSINIIGFGNAGTTFYHHLKNKFPVKSVWVRSQAQGDAPFVHSAAELDATVDLTLVCVNDDAIATVADLLPKHIPVAHTSGSVPLSVFNGFDQAGVLYPLQTLSKKRQIDLSTIPFLIEGNAPAFEEQLLTFCKTNLSANYHLVDSERRLKAHLAAVICNNFSTYLLGAAADLIRQQGLPQNLLDALIEETVSKYKQLGYEASQTGPARRKDEQTIQKHIALLEDPEIKEIYRLISRAIEKKFTA